jgi:hypothetical protein
MNEAALSGVGLPALPFGFSDLAPSPSIFITPLLLVGFGDHWRYL